MRLNYLIKYMVADFLMDQKDRMEQLEAERDRTVNERRIKLLELQRQVCYRQGLEALARFELDCPQCVRKWFLGLRKTRPSAKEIMAEMSGRCRADAVLDRKLVYCAIALGIGILTMLYFFGR